MKRRARHWKTAVSIERIKHVLATSELSMDAIAKRFDISHSTVVQINAKFAIRIYSNQHTWLVGDKQFQH